MRTPILNQPKSSCVVSLTRPLRRHPICHAIALWTMLAGAAHAAPLNLSHVGSAAPGTAIPGVTLPGLGNLSMQPQVAQQTVLNLGHVAAALSAQLAAQQAAAAAVAGTTSAVPNGLAKGGLQVLAGGTWSNANAPTQALANGQTTVSVQQTGPQALLDWNTFNIGRQTTLDFDQQGNPTWVALNRVLGASSAPSQILGSIQASGQVYVINQNGIIFGAGSQVNTGALLASSASLAPTQFTANGIYSPQSGGVYTPSFTNAGGAIVVEPGAQISTHAPGAVTAGGGYVLLMGTSVSNQGMITTPDGQSALAAGDNFLIRPGYSTAGNSSSTTNGNEIAVQLNPGSSSGTVSNTGLMQADTGDITLVGHHVTQGGVALASTSVSTRGTIHLLNSASDSSGSVTLSPDSVTAIIPDTSGATALASQQQALLADSATQDANRLLDATAQFDDLSLLPDLEDASRIEIVTGGTAQFQPNSLSMAQGGQIAVSAAQRVQVDSGANLDVSGTQAILPMSANNLAVSIEGAELADAPTNRDTNALNSTDVTVDAQDLQYVAAGTGGDASARYYTKGGLLEVSGELSNVGQTIDQWLAPGGSITLSSGASGAVVAQSGAVFNLAGGALQYQAGTIAQSWLLGTDGHVYNVNTAPASMQYVGLYDGFVESHPAWGVTKNWINPLIAPSQIAEAGYTVGKNAGSLVLSTPTAVFAGTIVAAAETGQQQTKTAAQDPNPLAQDVAPQAGLLALGQSGNPGGNDYFDTAVQFGAAANQAADALSAQDPIPDALANTAYLDAPQLSGFGLGGLSVTTGGAITVNAPLILAAGGQLTLTAPDIDVAALLRTHGGSVSLGNIDGNGGVGTAGLTDPNGRAQVTLETGATLDTTGLWTNALLDPADLVNLPYLNGGSVSIDASQGITLKAGSTIDASAGGAVLSISKSAGGAGGDITLIADDGSSGSGALGTAPLILNGTLESYGVTQGGKLTLRTGQRVVIADQSSPTGNALPAGPAVPTLNLSAALFSSGFSAYSVSGSNGVTVLPGTQLNVTEPVLEFTDQSDSVPSGSDPADALALWTPPLYLQNSVSAQLTQRAGASLALNGDSLALKGSAQDSADGPITIGTGAQITVDAGQSIDLVSPAQITVDGKLHAPGGTISITDNRALNQDAAYQSIWIGSDAVLDVAAQAYTALDRAGRPYGIAPSGGNIVLGAAGDTQNTQTGVINSTFDFIIVRPGAVLDAAGSGAQIDPAAGTGSASTQLSAASAASPITLAGNGGTISMSSYSGIYSDGTMNAAAGGVSAAGGSFNATLETAPAGNDYDPTNPAFVPSVMTLSQTAIAPQLPATLQPGMSAASLQFGQARFSADTLAADGFGTLSFTARDAIVFDGNVNLQAAQSIAFHQGALADTSTGGHVTVRAPYVMLDGQSPTNVGDLVYEATFWGAPQPSTQASTGRFSVDADLIDIGDTLQFGIDSPASTNFLGTPVAYDYAGFANLDLTSQGDIRFIGAPNPSLSTLSAGNASSVTTSGDATFTAAQIYPVFPSGLGGTGFPLYTSAVITAGAGGALDPDSVITLKRISGVAPSMPYAALGNITLNAATINQGGVLRAPEGFITLNGSSAINLLPGSITSTSMNGQTVLLGGTVDGINWNYAGATVQSGYVLTTSNSNVSPNPNDIALNGPAFNVAAGALIDVSGGGDLAGAGFIQGQGGSVNVLATPLANANPANTYSAAGAQVYAILPGYSSGYAPVDRANGAAPGLGQQITVGAGVPGLPAGTYTLLPANYALLPGGYRVELGKTSNRAVSSASPALASGNGDYLVYGYQSVAHAGVANPLPTELIVTPGSAVRNDSDFDETDYSNFEIKQAAALENIRPQLTIDGGTLALNLSLATPPQGTDGTDSTGNPSTAAPAFTFNGTALFAAGTDAQSGVGGEPGQAQLSTINDLDIYNTAPAPGFTGVAVAAGALSNIAAPNLAISAQDINLDGGTDLRAAQVILSSGQGGSITLAPGAEIDTIGMGSAPVNAATGNLFTVTGSGELVVSNGTVSLDYVAATDGNGNPYMSTIDIGAGAKLYSEGTIGFASGGPVTIADSVAFGTANLGFSAADINIGDPAAMAQATVPSGLNLTQARLDQLLAGDTAIGAPPLQTLTLSASQSFNVFGSVNLDVVDPATAKADLNLVLDTPAIYGYGSAADIASLTVGTLTWSGVTAGSNGNGGLSPPAPPGPVIANGPGTGSGTLNVIANQITFGFPADVAPDAGNTYNRVMLGFSTVNLIAPEITSNDHNTLAVYQTAGADPSSPGSGGNLNLVTPLLSGAAASIMGFTVGGTLTLAPPPGTAAATPAAEALGAEIDLVGNTINVGSSIVLPSGKLSMSAAGDIALQPSATLDLAGQATTLVDQTEYSWGGTLLLQSTGGNITQAAGSSIDVSAVDNNAGSITLQALGANAGQVALNGTLRGAATLSSGALGEPEGGTIAVSAQTLASGSASNLSGDFAALNLALNSGGFNWSRGFDLRQGDLAIGDELQAHNVSVSVDHGSLSVNGTINASGITPGSISLAALNDLTVNGTLDAHGTMLAVDSYGNPIDAENQGSVNLSAVNGLLTLAGGATIDVSVTSPQGQLLAAGGTLELNAPRTADGGFSSVASATGTNAPANATGDDVNIAAAGPLNIKGAASIALNAFTTYTNAPTDPNASNGQVIDQAYLDQINTDSQAFMTAADQNAALQAKLAGLTVYGKLFHLRPGFEIASATANGNLTIASDIDLAGYRYSDPAGYGAQVNSAINGSGEPGTLVLRAGGNLTIDGSVSDGFGQAPASPDDGGWSVTNAGPVGSNLTLFNSATIGAGSTFGAGSVLGYAIPILGGTIPANTPTPGLVTLSEAFTLQAGTTINGALVTTVLPGQVVPGTIGNFLQNPITLAADWYIDPNSVMGNFVDNVEGGMDYIPPGSSSVSCCILSGQTIPAGTTIPANDNFAGIPAGLVVPANVFPHGIPIETYALSGALQAPLTLAAGTQLPGGTLSPAPIPIVGPTLAANTRIPVNVTLADAYLVPQGFSGAIKTSAGSYGAGQTIPSGAVLPAGTVLPDGNAQIDGMTWPAGAPLTFSGSVTLASDLALQPGDVIPAGATLAGVNGASSILESGRSVQALAPMLPAGDLSWSMQFVSGAELSAANTALLQPLSQLAGGGNLTLNDPHVAANGSLAFSVLRTGTGSLGLLAGGDFDEQTLYGIYTAGTQIPGIGATGTDPYNLARGQNPDGSATVLGYGNDGYEAALQDYSAYYPAGGGNLLVAVQGNLNSIATNTAVSNWLWTQGGAIAGQSAAWWVNFGTYGENCSLFGCTAPALAGFTGFGTLGGGNLTLNVGGNASGVVAAVVGTGRVLADGTLAETGGGTLTVSVGGDIDLDPNNNNSVFTDIRGNTTIDAGAIGTIGILYGAPGAAGTVGSDPRYLGPLGAEFSIVNGGLAVNPGDGAVTISTRGDLVLDGVGNPGIGDDVVSTTPFANGGVSYTGMGQSWFSLWTDATAINLFAAGGNLTPALLDPNSLIGTVGVLQPATLNAIAASGSIYIGTALEELAPAPNGQLNLLAENSIIGGTISMSGADPSVVPTPFDPAFFYQGPSDPDTGLAPAPITNVNADSLAGLAGGPYGMLAYGPDTPTTDVHANDPNPIRIYAATGDIVGFDLGAIMDWGIGLNPTNTTPSTWYLGAKAVDMVAGRDIVVSGTQAPAPFEQQTFGFILNDNPTDVSLISAGRDIIYSDMQVAGPGLLEVQAGANYYAANGNSLVSLGPLINVDPYALSGGAGITLMAGVGAKGPDYSAFANLYLNPANQADAVYPDTDPVNAGKVPMTYQDQLYTWLQQTHGYRGDAADAYAYFETLSVPQQSVFLLQVYFDELNASGLEFNEPSSKRFKSYLRGRDAIATLFPGIGPNDPANADTGDITLFGSSGIHTDFGGTIQTLTPGGQTIVGVEGPNPPDTAGVITQGSGAIDMYADDSILLGQSRVMTTFGGDIVMWSATGDIDAGEGSKTTVVYTPARRIYDNYGNVALSPTVPSQGAGIAALNPIPGVPPSDVNLVAPEGVVDAGEAGIRVSGNLNVAALRVENAANIQVQGKTTGVPVQATVNTGALTAADSASAAVTQIAQNLVRNNTNGVATRHWVITVQVEGFGDAAGDQNNGDTKKRKPAMTTGYNPTESVAILGVGGIGSTQRHLLSAEEQSKLAGF